MVWISDAVTLADKQDAYNLASALRYPVRPPVLVTIDDPEAGRMRGAASIESWMHEQHTWQFEAKVTTRLIADVRTDRGDRRVDGVAPRPAA